MSSESAEHGLTITTSGGRYWGACICGWKSYSQSNITVSLRFGEHLLEAKSAATPVDAPLPLGVQPW